MSVNLSNRAAAAAMSLLALAASGCGEYVREQGRSPSQVVILSLLAAPGSEPDEMGSNLISDVLTGRTSPEPCTAESPCFTVFNDVGEVTMTIVLKDQGVSGITAAPSALNAVTIDRYRVVYRRTDGRNTPGVDVPFPFDGGTTFTVPASGTVTHGFELVRNTAKSEAPLRALVTNGVIIATIAEVTFFGRDLAGNAVQASGNIQVNFGNFGNP